MTVFSKTFLILILALQYSISIASLSHGPVLGDISDRGAAIWIRTTEPEMANIKLRRQPTNIFHEEIISTVDSNDNTYTFRFSDLQVDANYTYQISINDEIITGNFKTLKSNETDKDTVIVFGSCYFQGVLGIERGLIFDKMMAQKSDAVIILGDFPYSDAGGLDELRTNHKLIRSNNHFSKLTSSVPVYAIWDDHDYGNDNSDGTNRNKDFALKVFNEYWPNPINPDRKENGIYTSFVINNVEIFLLDTRYHSYQRTSNPILLGDEQFSWLCSGLNSSEATYKVIASGVPLASNNSDGWSGKYYARDKEKLFSCIYENEIPGVIMISGDSHRSEIHQFNLNGLFSNNTIYDFTSSPMKSGIIKREGLLSSTLEYSYEEEDSLFAKLVFGAESKPKNIEFTLISPVNNEIKKISLNNQDLNYDKVFGANTNRITLFIFGLISIVVLLILSNYVYMKKHLITK